MLDRIEKGDRISLGGAVVLLLALFMPWYGIGSGIIGGSFNAFESFDILDIVLLLLAVGAGAIIVLVAIDKIDASLHRFVETIGGVAAIAILIRLVIKPVDSLGLKWGIFVALLGAVGIAAGQFLTRTGKI